MNYVRNKANLPVIESSRQTWDGSSVEDISVVIVVPPGFEFTNRHSSDTAVIHDEEGNVVYNAWQQDAIVHRITFRKKP